MGYCINITQDDYKEYPKNHNVLKYYMKRVEETLTIFNEWQRNMTFCRVIAEADLRGIYTAKPSYHTKLSYKARIKENATKFIFLKTI